MSDGHAIPPMTHELSRHWRQPNRDEILIDDTHAVMSAATWEKLARYDTSTPSGVYEGKMWRRRGMLCWFGFSDVPNSCSNNARVALIVEQRAAAA